MNGSAFTDLKSPSLPFGVNQTGTQRRKTKASRTPLPFGGPQTRPTLPTQFARVGEKEKRPPTDWTGIAHKLGTLGQAIMGEHTESWQAKVGEAAAGMAQKGAYRSTLSKVLAGEDLGNIPEASVLTPEQMTQVTSLQAQQTSQALEEKNIMARYELGLMKQGLDEDTLSQRMTEFGDTMGFRGEELEAKKKMAEEEITSREKIAGEREETERREIGARKIYYDKYGTRPPTPEDEKFLAAYSAAASFVRAIAPEYPTEGKLNAMLAEHLKLLGFEEKVREFGLEEGGEKESYKDYEDGGRFHF